MDSLVVLSRKKSKTLSTFHPVEGRLSGNMALWAMEKGGDDHGKLERYPQEDNRHAALSGMARELGKGEKALKEGVRMWVISRLPLD